MWPSRNKRKTKSSQISMSNQLDTSEHLSMLRDPKFYLENFTKIKGKKPGYVPFILNEAQKDLFNTLNREHRIIILKARQIGFSSAVTGFYYHKTITTPGITTALIGYNSDLTMELLDKVKTLYRTTPEQLRPRIHYNSKYEISFPAIDSKIIILPSTENVGRGYTIHNALCTELAFWDKPESKMLALENAVPEDGSITIESTPNGVGNLYHKMWVAEDNGYVKKEYGWWWMYSEEEIERMRKRIGDPRRFAQEYELEFLSAGRTVFDHRITKEMRKDMLKVGDKVQLETGEEWVVREMYDGLRVYKPPQIDRKYVMGVDVAEGVVGGDSSVVTIFDRTTGEEVAFFRGHIPADILGERVATWGGFYNTALAVVEVNNHGLTTLTALKNKKYKMIYFRPSKFDSSATQYSDRIGWKTTQITRPLMIDDLAEIMRDRNIKIHSKETLDEMLTFIYNDAWRMEAESGFHDDCIFSTAIAIQGFKALYDKPLDQLDYSQFLPKGSSY